MKDDFNISRGFGFCCFESEKSAKDAINEMNGKIIGDIKESLFVDYY
jgi:RNA recognition motif-containing protein